MTRMIWRGNAVKEVVLKAAADAIDETTERAAADARANHWWRSRSGVLEAQVRHEPASFGTRPRGKFGITRRGFYGLFLERRSPFLRPAADREFPRVKERMRRRIK